MSVGIGIDTVDITEFRRLCADWAGPFVQRSFSPAERDEACLHADPVECLAGKFAVKEAVFKALGHLSAEGGFDFRIVETLEDDHGCPHVTCEGSLAGILTQSGAREILVSITNERDFATAIALVQ